MKCEMHGLSHFTPPTSHSDQDVEAQSSTAERTLDRPVVVVGLGNPGMEYVWTPHNAGFMAIDRIALQQGIAVQNRRCKALTGTTSLAGRQVILAKPETYMNERGLSVAALVREFQITPEDRGQRLIVLYDELDLPLGTMKIKERGSAAGHNGARSVSAALGGHEWLRVRIGVGPEFTEAQKAAGAGRRGGRDYLLDPMRKADLGILDEVLDRVAMAVRMIVDLGPAAAMNEFNRSRD